MKLCTRTVWLKALLVFAVVLPLLTGCWDRQEIEERAVVLGIGIDDAGKAAAGEESEVTHMQNSKFGPEDELIRMTLQIAVPGRIPLGPGTGGGMGGGGGGQNTVWVVDGVGHTVDDAINNLQQRVSPPLFFGHLRVIVVSEDVAKRGITNLNDYFRRNPDIRRMNWMFICEGEAYKLMKASPQLERVPSLYLMNTMDQAVKMGRFPNSFLGIFWSSSSAKGKEGFLPYVKLKGQDTVEISGLALFRNEKLVGTTTPLEIPVYMGIVGMNPAGGQAFIEFPNSSERVLFGSRNRKSKIVAEIQDGKPLIKVHIMLEGNILEKANNQINLTHQTITQLETIFEKAAVKNYEGFIKNTQEKRSDIFGFGEYIRAKQPAYWNREIKTRENWQRMYATIPVEVSLKVHIRRVGMKAR